MKAKELIKALSELSEEDKELEVRSIEEIWYCNVSLPRIGYIDEEGRETGPDGEKIVMI
jgi:hypothetical protein